MLKLFRSTESLPGRSVRQSYKGACARWTSGKVLSWSTKDFIFLPLFLICLFVPQSVFAQCKSIYKIPDLNCDGDLQIVVIGDSFVYGIGDTKNRGRGGYVLRTQRRFSRAAIQNLGTPGLQSPKLLEDLQASFRGRAPLNYRQVLRSADIVIFDLGRNDRWLYGEASDTVKNLQAAAQLIRLDARKRKQIEPVIVIAPNMLPNRGSQGPWVSVLNKLILRTHTSRNPADLRFDLVSKRLIGDDQIHPTSLGYDELAKVFQRYLQRTLPPRIKARQREFYR